MLIIYKVNKFMKIEKLNIEKNYFAVVTALVFVLVALNSIFNSISVALGNNIQSTTFLIPPYDLFGDYFKAIFSFSADSSIKFTLNNFPKLNIILNNYIVDNNYKLINPITGLISNLNGMPFSTLFCLINLWIMSFINPLALFFFNILSLLLAFYYVVIQFTKVSKYSGLLLFIALVISYPILFMFVRGHLLSAITNLLLLIFILSIYNKKIGISILALALVCNIRPNAGVFSLLFLINFDYTNWKILLLNFVKFILLGLLIFFVSLAIAHDMYPPYTFANFLTSVRSYHDTYMVGDAGLAFGSSLMGGIKLLMGYNKNVEFLVLGGALIFIFLSVLQYVKNKIDPPAYIFLICSIYCLATSVFADYYLGIFIAPIISLYLYKKSDINFMPNDILIFVTCVILLAPKNYIFNQNGISYQVLINPLILLSCSIYILGASFFSGSKSVAKL